MPGLGFDKKGNRLGRGKGFYDTYLERCRTHPKGKPYTIALAFKEQLCAEVPVAEHDILIDEVLYEDQEWTAPARPWFQRCSKSFKFNRFLRHWPRFWMKCITSLWMQSIFSNQIISWDSFQSFCVSVIITKHSRLKMQSVLTLKKPFTHKWTFGIYLVTRVILNMLLFFEESSFLFRNNSLWPCLSPLTCSFLLVHYIHSLLKSFYS